MTIHQETEAKKLPWWAHFIGPVFGIAILQLVERFVPPLGHGARQSIAAVAAILIAAVLTRAIYRFVRM